MSAEFEQILDELREIRDLVSKPAPRPDDLVGADYVVARTGISLRTVIAGKAGTNNIPRVMNRPVRFRRGDVDQWLRKLAQAAAKDTTEARVLDFYERQEKKRRKRA